MLLDAVRSTITRRPNTGITLVDEYAEHGEPVLITVGAEGFVDTADEEGQMSVTDTTEMAEDLITNPASRIPRLCASLSARATWWGGAEMVQITAPFTYDDGLQVVWHDRIELTDEDHATSAASCPT